VVCNEIPYNPIPLHSFPIPQPTRHYQNSALCRVLSALPSAFCRALGKVLLLITTVFIESRTLGTERHSAKTTLSSAKHSANGGARQRTVSSHRLLTDVIFVERRALAFGKKATFSSLPHPTLIKVCFAECHSWTLKL
jgi:hypothetical protein